MQMEKYKVAEFNNELIAAHKSKFDSLAAGIPGVDNIIRKLQDFQVAIPSWALGTGGTRFGRFSGGGEPRTLEEKIEDVGLLHKLNQSSGAISLHIPWDIPKNPRDIRSLAAMHGLRFDAMNSNTFQDQPHQEHTYKFGSMQNVNSKIRKQ